MTSPHRFSSEIRVRLSETDALGIVFHANFFTWMDVSRIDYLRNIGQLGELHPTRLFTSVMVHASCDFETPARFDDALVMYTNIVEIGRTSFSFECEIVHKRENRVVARGRSTLVAVDNATWKPIPVPEAFRVAVRAFEGPDLKERKP